MEHRAQVAVYTLLMNEKYKLPVEAGLLYYIKTNHMQGVSVPQQERRALIMKRNAIARNMTLERQSLILPGES